MTSTIQQGINKVEAFLGEEKDKLEAALEKEWAIIKPDVIALGKTVLSQVWTAAAAYIAGGFQAGGAAAAIASVTAQLPAELVALEHIVASAFAGAVASQSQPAAPTAPAS